MNNLTEKQDPSEPFRTVAIAGGGMRGYYAACLLYTLSKRFQSNERSNAGNVAREMEFNLICGTSTGAILACALAKDIPLLDVIDFYKKFGRGIFTAPKPRNYITSLLWELRHLWKSSGRQDYLRKGLHSVFGDETIGELYEKRKAALCIPAVNASNHKARVFKTPHGKYNEYTRDTHCKIVDICMASSAAPIIFRPYKMKNPDNPNEEQFFVDGCMWANDPVVVALVEALLLADSDQSIHILSIGTASEPSGDPKDLHSPIWGLWKWKRHLPDIALSSQATGNFGMANLLARAISNDKRKVKILAPVDGQKSHGQYSRIGVDRASPDAISTMADMASSDADDTCSKILRGNLDKDIRAFFIPANQGGYHGTM